MKRFLRTVVLAASFPALAVAQTSTVVGGGFSSPYPVASYSMLNGASGYYNYRDYTYQNALGVVNPNANTDFAWLSGGKGLLTDGIGASVSWDGGFVNPPGVNQGQFVGWYLEPLVTFYFTQAVQFSNMRVNFDLSYTGDVGPPGPLTVNGVPYAVTIPTGTAPFWADFDLTGSLVTNTQAVQFTRGAPWLMVSEVQFVTATPEPGSLVLLATGVFGLIGSARHRRRAARIN